MDIAYSILQYYIYTFPKSIYLQFYLLQNIWKLFICLFIL